MKCWLEFCFAFEFIHKDIWSIWLAFDYKHFYFVIQPLYITHFFRYVNYILLLSRARISILILYHPLTFRFKAGTTSSCFSKKIINNTKSFLSFTE